jgi:hypothetical protein
VALTGNSGSVGSDPVQGIALIGVVCTVAFRAGITKQLQVNYVTVSSFPAPSNSLDMTSLSLNLKKIFIA